MMIYANESKGTTLPSSVYMAVSDFAIILEDIRKGVIPTGSQHPYPLFDQREIERMKEENNTNKEPVLPPWLNN